MFSLVVSRPVATWMIAIAIAVFGMVSYGRLPLNLMPDLSYPSVTVRTEVPGYAPEEVESQISRPIEEAIATTQGLAELESRSRAGVSDVVLEFRWGTDMNRATQDIRERLQTTFLPQDASRPLILRYDPSMDPIMRIALSMEGDSRLSDEGQLFLLRDLAVQEIQRELEAMDGVAAVSVRGGLEREILVEPREDWLAARGLTIDQLINTLGSENVNIPGGAIRDGDHEYLVRTLNQLNSLDEIRGLQITRSDGVRVPISEVATVRESFKEREVISRLDAVEAVEIEVFKAADANIVSVAAEIEASLEEDIRPDLPEGVVMTVLENQAGFIEASINNLRSTAILGAFLAVVVLFLFLRDFRSTAIIGAAIPLSIVCTFAPMYLGGVSLNLMSLGGLALGVGMLVDNAVVVLENIQVHIEAGKPRRQAAVDGTAEVAAAVIASTLTTISVFAPIAFVEGIAGQIFSDLSMAVVFSLLASLAVALFFVPMLAAAELAPPAMRTPLRQIANASRFRSIAMLRDAWRSDDPRRLFKLPWWIARSLLRLCFEVVVTLFVVPAALLGRGAVWVGQKVLPVIGGAMMWAAGRFQRRYNQLEDRYSSIIQPALARPGLVMGIAAASVLLAIPLGASLSQALIPEVHQGRFAVEVSLPVGTPLPTTSAVVRRMEQAATEHPQIANVHAIIGSERRADSRPDEGEHTAKLMVELTPGGNLARREDVVMTQLRTQLLELTEGDRPVDLRLSRPSLFSFRTPIEVVFYGADLDHLRDAADDSVRRIGQLPGVTDVRSSLMPGYPEVRIVYDRDLLRRYNLNTATVASRIREKIQGEEATSISRGDVRVDLVVRLDESERRSVEQLKRLNINPNVNPPIPLESVASFIESEGPSEIRRVDQRRAAVVSANLDGFDLSAQAEAIAATLGGSALSGIEWELTGQNAEMERSSSSLKMALGLAIFLVYVIMASTFESILHPFVILFSVPLALVGVVGTLWVTGVPVSVVVFIGAIVLAGVVVNNAIVLVDTINRRRAGGMARIPAIAEAARLRLRPILITTTTTVLGLLPLALGIGEGAEIQMPLATTVIAGLSSSTLLTLVVIPVVYLLLTSFFEADETNETAELVTPTTVEE